MVEARHPLVAEPFFLFAGFAKWRSMLIMSDLHIGKTMHFRKAGLPIPAKARDADFARLIQIFDEHRPETVIVLGDLFHSSFNSEMEELSMITSSFGNINFRLVIGNHDILDPSIYRSLDFECSHSLAFDNLVMTHEPMEHLSQGSVNIHGHIHPGVHLKGKARQSISAPCFHFSTNHICLPAFGSLTGHVKTKVKKGDQLFAIVNNQVLALG